MTAWVQAGRARRSRSASEAPARAAKNDSRPRRRGRERRPTDMERRSCLIRYHRGMPPDPKNLQVLGTELALAGSDGAESYFKLADLRRLCPCAECQGERDLLGRLMKPPARPLTAESYQARGTSPVGGYALQIHWGDGHADGLYTVREAARVDRESARASAARDRVP